MAHGKALEQRRIKHDGCPVPVRRGVRHVESDRVVDSRPVSERATRPTVRPRRRRRRYTGTAALDSLALTIASAVSMRASKRDPSLAKRAIDRARGGQ